VYKDHVSRHRQRLALYDKQPCVGSSSFVAPCATLVGDVTVADGQASVW
jgi:carbonic anhydrase/acetyltransferase-like protein (isoleucine patch superfamily)